MQKVILRRFYGCLAGAVNYLYAHRVRHRDLTTRNILIDSAGEVYISDFGSAYDWMSKTSSKTKHRGIPTSPDYMAPEISNGVERGTKSDMWSLGLVFLEMTTKLLGYRPSELREKIRIHANKAKVQPYAHANIKVLVHWMQFLGQADTEHGHDREPLSWAKDLLHAEPEHRLTPPQLMRYIRESPSLGLFCCLKCGQDFHDDAFTYGPVAPKSNFRRESQQTRAAIEAYFDEPTSNPSISQEGSESIKKWIEASSQYRTSTDKPSAQDLPYGSNDNGQSSDNRYEEELLYRTSERGLYPLAPPHKEAIKSSLNSGSLPSPVPLESARVLADEWSFQGSSDSLEMESASDGRGEIFQDSGLGFLEYMSNSSDGEKPLPLFEESSDRSTIPSEEDSHIGGWDNPIGALLPDSGYSEAVENKASGQQQNSDLMFEEEEDKSDVEPPWEEAMDQSEPEDRSQIDEQDTANFDTPMVSSVSPSEPNANNQQPLDEYSNFMHKLSAAESTPLRHTTEPEDVARFDVQRSGPALSVMSKQTMKDDNTAQSTPPEPDEASKLDMRHKGSNTSVVSGQEMRLEHDVQSTPTDPNMVPPPPNTRIPTKSIRAVANRHVGFFGERGQAPVPQMIPDRTIRRKTRQKTVRISETPENFERKGIRSKHDERFKTPPEIVINYAGNALPASSARLSEKNVGKMEAKRLPITPRQRDTLIPVDVNRLIRNTWEMASSAPTSAMSEDTRSKIHRLFFMIPTDAQIESALNGYCKRGSASAVKTILSRVVSNKPLKHRQYFIPLLHAVRGASSRHNKCVRELLAVGVNPNHTSRKTGQTPLHIAIQHSSFHGYSNLIWLLLSSKIKANPNIRDWGGETPLTRLFVGADTTPLELFKRGGLIMLLKEGASPDFRLPGTGNTPLHLAVRRQDKIAVAVLLHMGAKVNVKNTSGTTPLQMTANQFRRDLSANHAEVLDHLLHPKYGAHVDERAGAMGRTALHLAVNAGCAQAVTRLLEAGADPKLSDNEGQDAMALAIKHAEGLTAVGDDKERLEDHVEIMLGLHKGAKYEWKLKNGECAVETACYSGDGTLLRCLLDKGLNSRYRFREETVLDLVKRNGSRTSRHIFDVSGGQAL